MSNRAFEQNFKDDDDFGDPELNARWYQLVAHLHNAGCPVTRSEVGEG